jgi:hypothetical protein
MKVTIEINGDNAAFFDDEERINPQEYSRILHYLADRLNSGEPFFEAQDSGMFNQPTIIRDINGNRCGFISLNPNN